MRRLASISVLAIAGLLAVLTTLRAADDKDKELQSRLIGTWKLVSAKYGGEEVDLLKTASSLKHITPAHFMWLSYDPQSKVISRTAGGTYTIEGNQYKETPLYGFSSDFDAIRDKEHVFTCKVEGDTWTHQGKLANGLVIDEVWERVKPAR